MKKAVYPGSFDPVTNGHLDIITRASKIFDELVIAIGINTKKGAMFTFQERIEFLKSVTKGLDNVTIDCFDTLLINYVEKINANVIIKGLRAISDFEYEFQMAMMNQKLNPHIETVFMMTSPQYSYLSSTMLKEVAFLGGEVKDFVPAQIKDVFLNKIKNS